MKLEEFLNDSRSSKRGTGNRLRPPCSISSSWKKFFTLMFPRLFWHLYRVKNGPGFLPGFYAFTGAQWTIRSAATSISSSLFDMKSGTQKLRQQSSSSSQAKTRLKTSIFELQMSVLGKLLGNHGAEASFTRQAAWRGGGSKRSFVLRLLFCQLSIPTTMWKVKIFISWVMSTKTRWNGLPDKFFCRCLGDQSPIGKRSQKEAF